jgi:hypothetical protein
MTLEGKPPLTLQRRLENIWLRLQRDWRILNLNRQVKGQSNPNLDEKPIAIFNASTRLSGFSQNAAFNLLTTWGLQLANLPVVHFSCQAGMSRCVLGTNLDDHTQEPPCAACMAQSKRLLRSSPVKGFSYQEDPPLASDLQKLNIEQLSNYQFTVHNSQLNLGALVLPSLRWSLRRHHLKDDEPTRFLLREYIKSAYRVAIEFGKFLDEVDPQVVLVFNGTMYPEAIARWVAKLRGLRVITHEVGFQPFSTFFTEGQATAYPMQIPDDFELNSAQNERLDAYLSQRFKGEFTMAGIRFWPEISGLDEDFLAHAAQFDQIVPVFTNVINDTSQVHACTVFDEMYDWLAHVVAVAKEHPETLFVIRAHPDEKRIGTRKHSRQPVSDWVTENGILDLPNVLFVDAFEPLSSYDLMLRSKFIIVYNSSIGLEASLMGVPVLCGGKARYTQYPTVFFPQTKSAYQDKVREFLRADEIVIPSEFQRNARRVLYWQLFRSAMPLERYLSAHPTPGYVQLKKFNWQDLKVENSGSMQIILDGILNEEPFVLPEDYN